MECKMGLEMSLHSFLHDRQPPDPFTVKKWCRVPDILEETVCKIHEIPIGDTSDSWTSTIGDCPKTKLAALVNTKVWRILTRHFHKIIMKLNTWYNLSGMTICIYIGIFMGVS